MNINITETITSGQPTNGSCIVSGNEYSLRPSYFYIRLRLVRMGGSNKANCTIKHIGTFQELGHAHYQQNFSITCNHGNSSVGIQCFTHVNNEATKVNVQGTYVCE